MAARSREAPANALAVTRDTEHRKRSGGDMEIQRVKFLLLASALAAPACVTTVTEDNAAGTGGSSGSATGGAQSGGGKSGGSATGGSNTGGSPEMGGSSGAGGSVGGSDASTGGSAG